MTDTVEYAIKATYTVTKELIVPVEKGLDPLDPANWGDILDERDLDCTLDDTISYEANE